MLYRVHYRVDCRCEAGEIARKKKVLPGTVPPIHNLHILRYLRAMTCHRCVRNGGAF